MEVLSSLKFWNDDVDVRDRAPECCDADPDDDSFFELVFTAPGADDEKRIDGGLSLKNDVAGILEAPLNARVVPVGSNFKPQSPITLFKSAPKFRVLFLGFKKLKPEKTTLLKEASAAATPKHQLHKSPETARSKRFAVQCEVEEVQIASLFSRDNSLRSKLHRERSSDFPLLEPARRSSKDVPKYLRLIRPLYVRASRRYTSDNSRLSADRCTTESPWSSPATVTPNSPRKFSEEKRSNRGSGFRVISKHLGRNRSTSSSVRMTPSCASRRDDSLLLQDDGIQSAILHCKRSYHTSAQEYLWRSASDTTNGETEVPANNSNGDPIRCSSI